MLVRLAIIFVLILIGGCNSRTEAPIGQISEPPSQQQVAALSTPAPQTAPVAQAQPQLTDDAIRTALIQQSLASYPGSCACPYNTDRAGRSCGRRSAYSRPGGRSPLCYPGDVSAEMVTAYRASQ